MVFLVKGLGEIQVNGLHAVTVLQFACLLMTDSGSNTPCHTFQLRALLRCVCTGVLLNRLIVRTIYHTPYTMSHDHLEEVELVIVAKTIFKTGFCYLAANKELGFVRPLKSLFREIVIVRDAPDAV